MYFWGSSFGSIVFEGGFLEIYLLLLIVDAGVYRILR